MNWALWLVVIIEFLTILSNLTEIRSNRKDKYLYGSMIISVFMIPLYFFVAMGGYP